MVAKVQIKRTSTDNSPPAALDPGELSIEMGTPTRLWVGVPAALDVSGKKLLIDTSQWGNYVLKSGDTMTGELIMASASPVVHLNKNASGSTNILNGMTAGAARWQIQLGDATPEAGSDSGSDFAIYRWGDTGTQNIPPFLIRRATGAVMLDQDPTQPLQAATKQYVDALASGAGSNYVLKAGDTMTGPLVVTPKGSTFGDAGGAAPIGPVEPIDANIKLYDYTPVSPGNWAGIGTDLVGSLWFRAGLSGSPAPLLWLDSPNQAVMLSKDPAVPLQAATKQYVDSKAGMGGNYVLKAGDTMTGPLVVTGRVTATAELMSQQGVLYLDPTGGISLTWNGLAIAASSHFNSSGTITAANELIAHGGIVRLNAASTVYIWNDGTNINLSGAPVVTGFLTANVGLQVNGGIIANDAIQSLAGMFYVGNGGAYLSYRTATFDLFASHNFFAAGTFSASDVVTCRSSSALVNPSFECRDFAGGIGASFGYDPGAQALKAANSMNPLVALIAMPTSGVVQLGTGILSRKGQGSTTPDTSSYNSSWDGINLNGWVDFTNMGPYTFASDYRIKKGIAPLPRMWDTVKALRPVTYTQAAYTPPVTERVPEPQPLFIADDVERWGFVAHELQETLIPSAASGVKDQEDLIQSPNPWTMIAALTRALQEAMARIEALEDRVVASPR